MGKFRYTGTCEKGEVTLHGVTFPEGKAVEVEEDSSLAAKLESNSHFERVKTRKVKDVSSKD